MPGDEVGVVVPADASGRRSSSALGRAVVADALRGIDPVGAAGVERESNWRNGYPVQFRRVLEAALGSRQAAVRVASDGLDSLGRRTSAHGGERPRTGPNGSGCSVQETCSTRCYDWLVTEQISQRQLRNDSGRIMRALDDGQTFVVTRNGRPVGELRPLRRDRFVDAVTLVEVFRHAPRVDWERFRADVDQQVDQEVEPRA